MVWERGDVGVGGGTWTAGGRRGVVERRTSAGVGREGGREGKGTGYAARDLEREGGGGG